MSLLYLTSRIFFFETNELILKVVAKQNRSTEPFSGQDPPVEKIWSTISVLSSTYWHHWLASLNGDPTSVAKSTEIFAIKQLLLPRSVCQLARQKLPLNPLRLWSRSQLWHDSQMREHKAVCDSVVTACQIEALIRLWDRGRKFHKSLLWVSLHGADTDDCSRATTYSRLHCIIKCYFLTGALKLSLVLKCSALSFL